MSGENWQEQIQRHMAFILEQQAQCEVRWAKTDERWAKTDERWAKADELRAKADELRAKADERWAETAEGIRALLAIAEIHEGEFKELREAGRATDERLNALINVVERQISEGRNGKSSN
ncbi:MAG TPA: hypothetical protein VMS31_18915 [Pyrinomonadaceae bacterium]|nr:hypothetical protein [Pyrinomonadaceae bacterium]